MNITNLKDITPMLFPHRHWAGSGPVASSLVRRPTVMRVLAVVGCAVLSHGVMALPRSAAWGQTVSSATVTEVLDSDQIFIQNRRAAVNSVAQRQQRVRTQAARASLRFNNGAVARLAHNSSLMVGQCAQLNRGTLLVNGTLSGCSTTTVAGVRGTIYTLEVTEAGETIIQVFEGEVAVGQRTDTPVPDPSETGDEDWMEGEDLEEERGEPWNDVGPEDVAPNNSGLDSRSPSPESTLSTPKAISVNALILNPKPTLAFPWLPSRPDVISSPSLPSPDQSDGADNSPTDASPAEEVNLKPASTEDPAAEQTETVDFNPETVLVIAEGQQVVVNAESDEATISILTVEDFIALLEGPLMQGFSVDIPGIGDLQSVLRRLFPNLPMIPTLPVVPSLIIPQPQPRPSSPTSPMPTPSIPFPY